MPVFAVDFTRVSVLRFGRLFRRSCREQVVLDSRSEPQSTRGWLLILGGNHSDQLLHGASFCRHASCITGALAAVTKPRWLRKATAKKRIC